MELEWSGDALDDLERFADFLQEHDPLLARSIGQAIIERVAILEDHPRLGKPIAGREEYRQLVLKVSNGTYVFQYRYDHERLVMLRVFHSREKRA